MTGREWRNYTMRLPRMVHRILWPAVIPLVLFLSQGMGSHVAGTDGNDENLSLVGLTTSIGSLYIDPSSVTNVKELMEMGSRMNLKSLDSYLHKSREDAGDDSLLIAEHYREALVLMTACPALRNFEEAVQQALDTRCYKVLKCFTQRTNWGDEAQKHWFWAKIYRTRAFDLGMWEKQQFMWKNFWQTVFKVDNPNFYMMVINELSLKDISDHDIRKCIIMSDAVNILNSYYPDMAKGIEKNVSLMVEHMPARIMKQIVISDKDLLPDTTHIAPHAVKTAEVLYYLIRIGYTRIPKLCLRLTNGAPTIDTRCDVWLTEHNCLSLLQEMFQENPNYECSHNLLCTRAIASGSLDVLAWLNEMKEMDVPSLSLVADAVDLGHSNTVEWAFTKFKDQIDWDRVIGYSCKNNDSCRIIRSLRDTCAIPLVLFLSRGMGSEGSDWGDTPNLGLESVATRIEALHFDLPGNTNVATRSLDLLAFQAALLDSVIRVNKDPSRLEGLLRSVVVVSNCAPLSLQHRL
ncbi:hypothetical protein PSACC_00972 [Paramicrosporidium saccamoebae]|uniref:Uncharacterized protein n=1 Tax=Paramicrosporidium saccamoebae TaxID=1246581 RepID=A0A2H9TNA7_9FUNG|nr:hypothetical protein PSACC_00972 [Paramicrosporidium saccamoebae]